MRLARYAAIACCVAGSVALVGCTSDEQKATDKKLMEQDLDASPVMNRNRAAITRGKEMKAQGAALKQSGKTAEGDKMIAEGDKMIAEAQAEMDKANAEMKKELEKRKYN